MAKVSQPLLGADFLRAHSILIDVKGQRLIDSSDFRLHSTTTADSIASADDEFAKLLAQFPEITTPSPTPKHGVELFIPTKGPPGTTTSPG